MKRILLICLLITTCYILTGCETPQSPNKTEPKPPASNNMESKEEAVRASEQSVSSFVAKNLERFSDDEIQAMRLSAGIFIDVKYLEDKDNSDYSGKTSDEALSEFNTLMQGYASKYGVEIAIATSADVNAAFQQVQARFFKILGI